VGAGPPEPRKALHHLSRSLDQTVGEKLRAIEEALGVHPDCPHLLVQKAILIQVQDELDGVPGLEEVERCLLTAYALDDRFLEAIEELAHFYDTVCPDVAKARMFAERYIAVVTPVLRDLTVIRDGRD
jgi:hypothetical protein